MSTGPSLRDAPTAQDLVRAPREMRTARTVLRTPSPDMADERAAWAQATHDWLGFTPWWRRSADRGAARESLRGEAASVARGDDLIFEVFELATGAHVGRIDLHSWDFDAPRCELGYMADRRTAGRGLLREAAHACVELAFTLGAARVHAICDVDNTRSIAFAEALGFEREGILRAWERDEAGRLRDQVMLAIVTRPADAA